MQIHHLKFKGTQYLDNVAIRIAIQLNLFEILVKSEKPKSLVDIFEITKADPILLSIFQQAFLRGMHMY